MPLRLAVDHPAERLARLIGATEPSCDGIVVLHGAPTSVLACRIDANPLLDAAAPDETAADGEDLRPPWIFDPHRPGGDHPRLLSWSGTLAGGLFDGDPRNWGAGRGALDAFCDRVCPALERHGWTLCLHPHARHVLSDATSCREFARRRRGQPFEVALAPASMLEPSMLDAVDDHLERLFESLGTIASLVILEDITVPTGPEQPLGRVPLGAGVLPRATVTRLLREHVPAGTPVVIRGERVEEQRAWLEC